MALEFNEMSRNGQWGVIGLLCVAIVGVFYYTYWASASEEAARLNAEIQQMQIDNQRVRQVASQLPQLEEDLARMEGQLEILSSILPEERQTGELLRSLQTAATDVSLEIRRTDYQPPILHDFYGEMPVQLDVVGSFHDLARFFDRVSKFGRIVTVGEVTIQALADGSGNTIQATCTASTFFFLPDEEIAGADALATTGG